MTDTDPPSDVQWHALSRAEALAAVHGSESGLTSDQAVQRLAQYGPNRLPETRKRSAWQRFLLQFHNLLIYVLLASAGITIALAHYVDAAVIALVVIVNAIFGFVQEGRAENALEAVRAMVSSRANALRDGRRITVPAEELVPGDCVLLESGDRVPADLRLIRSHSLRVDEAMLTGESVAVDKSAAPVSVDAALGDRTSMAYSGTLVVAGQCVGLVVRTGLHTELGRISSLLGEVETISTPLLRVMDRFARQLTIAVLAVCAAVFAFATMVRAYPLADAFVAVVGIAVSAIPEGLPVVLTIVLAIGVQQMAARNAIIRRLPAVETLGAVSVICSDKTGTLTRNEMSVRNVVLADAVAAVDGAGYAPQGALSIDGAAPDAALLEQLRDVGRAALLCNDARLRSSDDVWVVDGDPMEGALLAFAMRAGLDPEDENNAAPRIDQVPFDARHRYMATLNRGAGTHIYVKGAPERIIGMCVQQRTSSGDRPLDASYWLQQVETLGSRGQRVLAVAVREMAADTQDLAAADVQNLTLLALVGMIDPPRAEVRIAVRECRSAGIAAKMITGDHAATAAAIAAELDLADQIEVAVGHDLDALDDAGLRQLARRASVFARTSPEHKLRLVQALQSDGSVIAMTGDGVNDAPALKRADIGVAMGNKGTAAAREAAQMVLADDNFATIVAAVKEGRTVYDNLRKVIAWTLPTNGGESLAIIGAILAGVTLPVTPIQILWINLVTATTLGLTLAFEPAEPDIMKRPPRRPDEPMLRGFLVWRIVFVSLLFALAVFGTFEWATARGESVETARTIAVNTIVVLEIFYLFSVRYLHMTSLTWAGVLGTRAVILSIAAVVVAQFLFTYLPFMNRIFASRPVSLGDGAVIVAVGVAMLLILEAEKFLLRRIGVNLR